MAPCEATPMLKEASPFAQEDTDASLHAGSSPPSRAKDDHEAPKIDSTDEGSTESTD